MEIKETILKYDINKYNFQEIVGQLYVRELNKIHNDSEEELFLCAVEISKGVIL